MMFDPGRETAALWVYHFSVLTIAVSLIQVPFTASIIAHEKMNIYAYMSIYDALIKLFIVFLIQWSPIDELIFYSSLMFCASFSSAFLYIWYCTKHIECRFNFMFDQITFRRCFFILGFSR